MDLRNGSFFDLKNDRFHATVRYDSQARNLLFQYSPRTLNAAYSTPHGIVFVEARRGGASSTDTTYTATYTFCYKGRTFNLRVVHEGWTHNPREIGFRAGEYVRRIVGLWHNEPVEVRPGEYFQYSDGSVNPEEYAAEKHPDNDLFLIEPEPREEEELSDYDRYVEEIKEAVEKALKEKLVRAEAPWITSGTQEEA